MWDLIESVPDHCLSFYFEIQLDPLRPKLCPLIAEKSKKINNDEELIQIPRPTLKTKREISKYIN